MLSRGLFFLKVVLVSLLAVVHTAQAGAQREEQLADSVRSLLRQSILASTPAQRPFVNQREYQSYLMWQARVSGRLSQFIKGEQTQTQLLSIVDYEAHRAGLEPALVLAVIEVESRFNPKAVSPVKARGLMQVMPFWTKTIGDGRVDSLHDARINVRYGCVILRHYLDKEQGDLVRALGRYNGSLGQMQYPKKVLSAMAQWRAAY